MHSCASSWKAQNPILIFFFDGPGSRSVRPWWSSTGRVSGWYTGSAWMDSEQGLTERLLERLPIGEAEECLRRLEERLITVDVLGIADAQDLADECGFTERQCESVLLDE